MTQTYPTHQAYQPNRSPFPRGRFLRGQDSTRKVHVLQRQANCDPLRKGNPQGYHHDLGAQDVFLDNFGLFLQEQVGPYDWRGYARALDLLMFRWHLLRHQVLQKAPYWGRHYNARGRQAQAGEPRSLLRWLSESDCARFSTQWLEELGMSVPDCLNDHRQVPDDLDDPHDQPWGPEFRHRLGLTYDWSANRLVHSEHWGQPVSEWPFHTGGVPLPPALQGPVRSLFLLPPSSATPDLPGRVGCSLSDFRLYKQLLRDQGQLGTCTSHAVAVALDLWARRCHKVDLRFSPAWLHCASGNVGNQGRSLMSVIQLLHQNLPCLEQDFPYQANFHYLDTWRGQPQWKTPQRQASSQNQTARFGRPRIDRLDVKDIATLKRYLAAGWPVVVSTTMPQSLFSPGFLHYGLGLSPYPGQQRESGHAWLLVGYDHVDGNQWKYQGSFITLNSWGNTFPRQPHRPETAGLCYLPFSLLYNEGIEAYALVDRPWRGRTS